MPEPTLHAHLDAQSTDNPVPPHHRITTSLSLHCRTTTSSNHRTASSNHHTTLPSLTLLPPSCPPTAGLGVQQHAHERPLTPTYAPPYPHIHAHHTHAHTPLPPHSHSHAHSLTLTHTHSLTHSLTHVHHTTIVGRAHGYHRGDPPTANLR